MYFRRIFWGLRAIFYKPIFGSFGFLSYMGKPLNILGAKRIFIGNRVRIQPGFRAETHNDGIITIKDNVSIGQNFHCTSGGGNLVIMENTTISGNIFVTNIDHDYTTIDVHILKQPQIIKETLIGPNCFIGFGAAIQAGTKLGKQCVVGTNSVVRGEFPDYCVIVGAPARIVKKYNPETKTWEKINGDIKK